MSEISEEETKRRAVYRSIMYKITGATLSRGQVEDLKNMLEKCVDPATEKGYDKVPK